MYKLLKFCIKEAYFIAWEMKAMQTKSLTSLLDFFDKNWSPMLLFTASKAWSKVWENPIGKLVFVFCFERASRTSNKWIWSKFFFPWSRNLNNEFPSSLRIWLPISGLKVSSHALCFCMIWYLVFSLITWFIIRWSAKKKNENNKWYIFTKSSSWFFAASLLTIFLILLFNSINTCSSVLGDSV